MKSRLNFSLCRYLVTYQDTKNGKQHTVYSKAVFICCGILGKVFIERYVYPIMYAAEHLGSLLASDLSDLVRKADVS